MRLMDILQQYTGTKTIASPDSAHDHFDEVARAAPPDILGHSVADVFRADSSPIAPQQASQVTAAQVQEIATHAEQQDPGVLDKIGGFYADHPQLVKTLGSAVLAIALAGVARRMRT